MNERTNSLTQRDSVPQEDTHRYIGIQTHKGVFINNIIWAIVDAEIPVSFKLKCVNSCCILSGVWDGGHEGALYSFLLLFFNEDLITCLIKNK